jgi:arginase
MDITIIGTPFNALRDVPELEHPPDGLRQAGLVAALERSGHTVTDLGDVEGFLSEDIRDPATGINDFAKWLGLSRKLAEITLPIVKQGSFPLFLGGDCRMLVGIVTGLLRHLTDVGLVFLDGHADFHTAASSPTGDPADMELAVLTGRGPQELTHIAGRFPMLQDRDVVVFGIRARDCIDDSDIKVYDSGLLSELGVQGAVDEGLRGLAERRLPVWLHLDVDVLDPDAMPVLFPEPGGLSFEECRLLMETVARTVRLLGLSVACYHPNLDQGGRVGKRLVDLIADVVSHPGMSGIM